MNTSTHMTPAKFVKLITTTQRELLPNQDYTIKSDEEFIDIVIPQIEKIMPDYLCDGVRSHPMAVYYGKNIGEYVYALLDEAFNWKIYPSHWTDHSLVLMAVYFGYEDGEHHFYLGDGAIIVARRDREAHQYLQNLPRRCLDRNNVLSAPPEQCSREAIQSPMANQAIGSYQNLVDGSEGLGPKEISA